MKDLKRTLFVITFAIFMYLGVQHIQVVFGALSKVVSMCTPFIVGGAIAFVLNIILGKIEFLWEKVPVFKKSSIADKLKRPVCIVLSILLVIVVVLFVVILVIPEISKTIAMIIDMLPRQVMKLERHLSGILENYEMSYFAEQLETFDWNSIGKTLAGGGLSIVNTTVSITTSLFSGIFNIFLGLMFALYILLQKEQLIKQGKKVCNAYLRKDIRERIYYILQLSNRIFGSFIGGQLLEAVILGVLCFAGMILIGIPYAPAISALVGFTSLIPMFGAFIGIGIGFLLIVMVNPLKAVWFVVFIVLLQQLEGNLVYPRVVGKSVGLPGIWVLVAVTIGGAAFGLPGMFVGVPLCSVVYTLFKESVNKRTRSGKQPEKSA